MEAASTKPFNSGLLGGTLSKEPWCFKGGVLGTNQVFKGVYDYHVCVYRVVGLWAPSKCHSQNLMIHSRHPVVSYWCRTKNKAPK